MVVFPGAKINIGLYVTDRRDDGYHNIETLFYPLGFSDILEVIPNRDSQPGIIDLTLSGLKVEGSAETNLVVRAYRLLDAQLGLPGVKAYLHKCIPTGAGLGGGSSDGASMLLLLNKLYDLNLSYCDLFSLALSLGSDCPFFLDPVPSFARSRGEELVQAGVSLRGLHVLLFHPGTGISTAAAYRYATVAKPSVPLEQMNQLSVVGWKGVIQNAFESYAFEQHPVIGYIKEELYRSGALYASMTGSGSAVYGLFDREIDIPAGISKYFTWKEFF
ncbi:MAG: 4-(cytidine 5'-diphospho)-2-C-methyl-D-erythritol kinase [Porphyromonadaceae bacterium]|nr:MAG: 4-(cytidine 5'-diphospho)-2-C-methyl-D-erythritol kinase [Porphyromonadaceae bacterium]